MRHRVAGRRLGRTKAHRLALMRNLSTSLIEKEKITTTLAKAKELRGFAERLVTLSKKETLHARRQVLRHIHDPAVVGKLFDTISARFAQRPGGYTRVIKLGPRRGDHAEMAVIELVESAVDSGRGEDEDAAETTPKAKPRKQTKRGAASKDRPAAGVKKKTPTKKKTPAKKAPTKKAAVRKKASTKKAGGAPKKSTSTVRKSS